MYLCLHTLIFPYVHVTYEHIRLCILRIHAYIYIYMYIHRGVHIYRYMFTCSHTHFCMYVGTWHLGKWTKSETPPRPLTLTWSSAPEVRRPSRFFFSSSSSFFSEGGGRRGGVGLGPLENQLMFQKQWGPRAMLVSERSFR